MGRSRTVAAVLAAAVTGLAGVVAAGPAGAAPAAGTPAAAARTGPPQQVTLITGDRVLVHPGGRATVRPAAGREHVRFATYTDRGDTFVVPADAAARLGRGTLDRRLFDVTALLAQGYGDAARDDIPLLVTHAPAAGPAARTAAAAAGGTEVEALPGARVSTLTTEKAAATRFWRTLGTTTTRAAAPVQKLWLDGKVQARLDHSVPQIGAPTAWAAGHTGAGTTVAVLDTGLDAGHPDFAGAVAGGQDFTETGSTQDDNGHGTHVASIVTGDGAASAGRYQGVAPDAKLLVGKVLDAYGSGYDSWIIAGMEWAAAQHADVVNMSLGSFFPDDGTDPMSQEVDRLTRETGTLFVVAAGNSGPYGESIGSPGSADEALTVGAVDGSDAIADFSSRGPRLGDGAIKPDVTAPGVDIVAARAAGSDLGEPVGDAYQRLSGTSMASPHVAGAAAILAGEHPDWTPAQLKAGLMGSARPTPGAGVFDQGAGRVDVARATSQYVLSEPASLSQGVARWPHQDDPAIRRTVTYRNTGTAAVTLDLAVEVTGPTGAPAPAGMFTLSAPRVTVPAGGTAAVTLTTDTRVAGPDGRYGGVLLATGGATSVRTPVAVDREVESYDVTVRATDRQGRPTPNWFVRFVDLDSERAVVPYDESGTVVARVPKGRWFVDGFTQPAEIPDDSVPPIDLYQFTEPTYVVSGDAELDLDGRRTRPVGLVAPRPAEPGQATVALLRDTTWGGTGTIYGLGTFDGFYVAPSRTSASSGFLFEVTGVLARPDGTGGFLNSPYQYHLGYRDRTRVPANLVRRFSDRGLAETRTVLHAPAPGLYAWKDYVASVALPGVLTERYSPGFDWYADVPVYDAPPSYQVDSVAYWLDPTPDRYARGARATQEWMRAVLGLGGFDLPLDRYLPPLGRLGDQIAAGTEVLADSAGHPGYLNALPHYQLYRDGVLLPEPEYGFLWTVPAEPAAYRLVADVTNPLPGSVSSRVHTEVRFRSGHPAGDAEVVPLPLRAVRFHPPVDAANAAPRRVHRVPVSVERQRTPAGYGRVTATTVQVSYDEGATWAGVPVRHGAVRLRPPAGAASVSLRSTVADDAGNRTDQTILRAYRLR